MKRITTLVATAATAMALSAAFSAATASAGTVLCDQPVTNCAQSDIKPAGSVTILGSINDYEAFYLKTAGGTRMYECGWNVTSFKSTMRNGNPLLAEFGGDLGKAGNCKYAGSGKSEPTCSEQSMNIASATIEATGSGGGTIKIGSALEPLSVSFKCKTIFGPELLCKFNATGTVTMTFAEGYGRITGAPMQRAAGMSELCSKTLSLYVEDPHDSGPMIAKATETVLCGQEPNLVDTVCPNSEILPSGSFVFVYDGLAGPGLELKRYGSTTILSCEDDRFAFETSQEAGAPLPATTAEAEAEKCGGFGGSNNCSNVAFNTPPASISSTGPGEGVVKIGTPSQQLTLSMTCESAGAPTTCSYAGSGIPLEVDPFAATINGWLLARTAGSTSLCGSFVSMHVSNEPYLPNYIWSV